jgi:hypothetical protein
VKRLLGEPAGGVLEGGMQVGRKVVCIEDRGAGLKRRRYPLLERHDGEGKRRNGCKEYPGRSMRAEFIQDPVSPGLIYC